MATAINPGEVEQQKPTVGFAEAPTASTMSAGPTVTENKDDGEPLMGKQKSEESK